MKTTQIVLSVLLAMTLLVAGVRLDAQETDSDGDNEKPRLIVLTDIGGGDTDDEQTLVRLLVYANEFDIEGLVAGSNLGHGGDFSTNEAVMLDVLDQYALVRDNLALHAEGFPMAQELYDVVHVGQPVASPELDPMDSIGDDKDTAASDWIIEVVDREDDRPVNFVAWGGTADLAQAIWRVANDRSDAELEAFLNKIRVYAVADQDSTGPWIRENYPQLFYILNLYPPDKFESVFRGMYRGGDSSIISREWLDENILNDHGPLGARYPGDAPGAEALKEGDTPSFFYFLPNGLSSPEHPEWGGWGGRFENTTGQIYRDALDTVGDESSRIATVWRWRPHFQNDFAARMDWTVMDYDSANHNPVAEDPGIRELSALAGEMVSLDAGEWIDPDGDALSYSWMVYPEAGTYDGQVALTTTEGEETGFVAPIVSEPQTVHVILSVTDDGDPALTSYRRYIMTVEPDSEAMTTAFTGPGTGLTGEYYDESGFSGELLVRRDAQVSFNFRSQGPVEGFGGDHFTIRWTGWIVPRYSETYTFYTVSDDGSRLWVDDTLLVDNWSDPTSEERSGEIALEAGQPYPILLEHFERGGGARMFLSWSSASQEKEIVPQEVLYPGDGRETVRIMPLGDSITQSNSEHNSWRRPLWFMLVNNGYAVDFVGSTTENHEGGPPDTDFDLDHEGHWGWRADEILDRLPEWAESAQPDIVLLHLGTNDLFQDETVETTVAEIEAIIGVLREVNPDVTVLVSLVIPHSRGDRAAIEPLNEVLPELVESLDTPESPVLLVDQYTGFDPDEDTFDRVHPNESGENKMARVWFEALVPLLEDFE